MAALEQFLADAQATEAFGARLAECCRGGLLVFLHGDLGAGKTTLVRGFLRAAGCSGPVKSPTYTLVEPYAVSRGNIYHVDLYRVSDEEELRYLGWNEAADLVVKGMERAIGAGSTRRTQKPPRSLLRPCTSTRIASPYLVQLGSFASNLLIDHVQVVGLGLGIITYRSRLGRSRRNTLVGQAASLAPSHRDN